MGRGQANVTDEMACYLPYEPGKHKHAHPSLSQNSWGPDRSDAEAWSSKVCHCTYGAAVAPAVMHTSVPRQIVIDTL